VYFKAFPACRHVHGTAQATLDIVRDEPVDPREIERVDVYTYTLSASLLDRYTDADSSMIAAQFSIPYVAAAAIVDRSLGTDQFSDRRIHDAAIIDLQRRVLVHADPAIDARYPEVTPTRVEIRLRSGDVLRSQVDMPKGDPRTPLSHDELVAKFRHLAGLALDADRVRRIQEVVLHIERENDLSTLFGLLEARVFDQGGAA
jgi:2-methylcitrate dehydratase